MCTVIAVHIHVGLYIHMQKTREASVPFGEARQSTSTGQVHGHRGRDGWMALVPWLGRDYAD